LEPKDSSKDWKKRPYGDCFKLANEQSLSSKYSCCATVKDLNIMQVIMNRLNELLNGTTALAIPCFYLYTSQSTTPAHLKNIDRQLFETLLSSGFYVGLSPVEVLFSHSKVNMMWNFPLLFMIFLLKFMMVENRNFFHFIKRNSLNMFI
jgi:hypothetical protein